VVGSEETPSEELPGFGAELREMLSTDFDGDDPSAAGRTLVTRRR
jgi:hypothetical protein